MLNRLLRRLAEFLNRRSLPSQKELVGWLVFKTASLELEVGENAYLGGVAGVYGAIKLSGNSLPRFQYTVFDRKLMEFVQVTVEISLPDRVDFTSKIFDRETHTHAREVETLEQYKKPFFTLGYQLFKYFPLVCMKELPTYA